MAVKRGWPVIGALALGAALFFTIRIAQGPSTVEAPGFLLSIDQLERGTPRDELHVAAYVPPTHPEYAHGGARATVIFPDGSRRTAETAELTGASLDLDELIGDDSLGLLVRMDFVDGDATVGSEERMRGGLPVKVRFHAIAPR